MRKRNGGRRTMFLLRRRCESERVSQGLRVVYMEKKNGWTGACRSTNQSGGKRGQRPNEFKMANPSLLVDVMRVGNEGNKHTMVTNPNEFKMAYPSLLVCLPANGVMAVHRELLLRRPLRSE